MNINYLRIRDLILKLQELEGNVRVFFMGSEYADTEISSIDKNTVYGGEVVVLIN